MSTTLHDWLTKCPAHDCNFKFELKRAGAADLRKAIEVVRGKHEKKTVLKALEARLQRLEKRDRE